MSSTNEFYWLVNKRNVKEPLNPEKGSQRFNVRNRVIVLLLNAEGGLCIEKSVCPCLIDIACYPSSSDP